MQTKGLAEKSSPSSFSLRTLRLCVENQFIFFPPAASSSRLPKSPISAFSASQKVHYNALSGFFAGKSAL
jgi:hypothetical protein